MGVSLSFFGADAAWHYGPVEPLAFKKVEGGPQLLDGLLVDPGDTLAFRENAAGQVAYGFVPLQNVAFEKLAWYEYPEVQPWMLGTLLLFASAVVLFPLGELIGRLRKRSQAAGRAGRLDLWVGWIVCALDLAFLLVMFLSFGESLVYGVPLTIRIMLLLPFATGVLTLAFLAQMLVTWVRGTWSFVGRLTYTLMAVAAAVCVLAVAYWNMVGWRF